MDKWKVKLHILKYERNESKYESDPGEAAIIKVVQDSIKKHTIKQSDLIYFTK